MRYFPIKFSFMSLLQWLMLLLIGVSIFAVLWIRSNVLALEYRLGQLEERKKALLREQKALLAERASVSSFSRIEKSENLYLRFPDRKSVIYITKKAEDSVSTISFTQKK